MCSAYLEDKASFQVVNEADSNLDLAQSVASTVDTTVASVVYLTSVSAGSSHQLSNHEKAVSEIHNERSNLIKL